MAAVAKVELTTFLESVARALDLLSARDVLRRQKRILLKPNLTIDQPPPVTTDVEMVEAVATYCQRHAPDADIIVADGTGVGSTTPVCYRTLGYERLQSAGVVLADLNDPPVRELRPEGFLAFEAIEIASILTDAFIISLPVLKGHNGATVTLSLKNMMGCYPRLGRAGDWKRKMHEQPVEYSIVDINKCLRPHLTVVDGSIGSYKGPGYHEDGICRPPLRTILASYDPVAADAVGAAILGHEWRKVKHIHVAHEEGIGCAEGVQILSGS